MWTTILPQGGKSEQRNFDRQVAFEYEQADQNQVQRAYAPSIAALNAVLTTNQVLLPGPPMQTSVSHSSTVVPNLCYQTVPV